MKEKIVPVILFIILVVVSIGSIHLWGWHLNPYEPACCIKLEEASKQHQAKLEEVKKQHQEQILLLNTEHDAYQVYFQQELNRLEKHIDELEKLLRATGRKSI